MENHTSAVSRIPTATDSGYRIMLLGGPQNPSLSEEVAQYLNRNMADCTIGHFSDGEVKIQINENVRGSDAYVLLGTSPPVNDHLMMLFLMLHTLRLSSAKRITAVIPYFGYARQDRKTRPRVPISASCVAQLIESMSADRVITVDLHCGQIQGFFHKTPVDNLFAEVEFYEVLRNRFPTKELLDKVVIVSPDAGGVARARRVADNIGASDLATITKRRIEANQVESMQLVGNVDGRVCIIVDDMIDTAGTLTKAAALLQEAGAISVVACATHGVFSGPAMQRLNDSCLEEVIVTNTIDQTENVKVCPKLTVISIAALVAKAIERVHYEQSLSVLFNGC